MGTLARQHPIRALTLAAGLSLTGSAPAQDDPSVNRPRAADRVVRVFDFEERQTNATDMPLGWVRAQHDPLVPRIRPDYPIWNQARLEYQGGARGEGAVRLDLRGGSGSLRLEPGVLPIFANGEYAVRVSVRAEGLVHARPKVVARLLDARGIPIEGTEHAVMIHPPNETWRQVEVRIPGGVENAAYIQIDLEAVQERLFRQPVLGKHQIWDEDVRGTVWFDDVVVIQMPQVRLATASPLNVVAMPLRPEIVSTVRDLAGEPMTATIRVYDAERQPVDSHERSITSGRAAIRWSPELPSLGWYRAYIDITAGGRLISSQSCDLLWVPEAAERAEVYRAGPRFTGDATEAISETGGRTKIGLDLNELPALAPQDLIDLLRACGSDEVSLPVWEHGLEPEGLPALVDRLRDVVASLREERIGVTLSLPVVPDALAGRLMVNPDQVLDVLAMPPSVWEPYLIDALDRLGGSVSRWQIGRSGGSGRAPGPDLGSQLERARAGIGGMVPGVEIELGWRADRPPPPIAPEDIVGVAVPAWMATAPMDLVTDHWAETGARVEYVLEPLAADIHTERDTAAELVRRAARLWRAGATAPEFALRLSDPWTVEHGPNGSARPSASLGAWRTLADRMRGRTFGADWDLGPGIRCMIFRPGPHASPERGGLIIAWREGEPLAELRATLGAGAVTISDIFGNTREIEPTSSEDGARSEHAIPLLDEPLYIEGIDTELALFLASVSIDPPVIQSVAGEREHEIVLRNPWPVPVTGRLIVTEPGGYDPETQTKDRTWEIAPRTAGIELQPGEEIRLPITLSFSAAAEAGVLPFIIDLRPAAEEEYGWVRARPRADLAWDQATLDLSYRSVAGEDGTDLVIEALVTNTGERPLALDAIAFAPGQPRARAMIGALEPGASIVRRFAFRGAFDDLAGERVYVSLSEPDGSGRLNRSIAIVRR